MKTVIIVALVLFGLFGPMDSYAATTGQQHVLATVSVARQQMDVVVDNGVERMTYSWKVSTARSGYVTPRGVYQPTWLSRHHRSREYDNAPMPFAVFFHNGYAVHATDAVSRLGTPASHGCVRLAPENAAQFFELVSAYGSANTEIVITD
jgi:lipoprotein-anchoring transpeptidase ErfK/SrfK